MIAANARRTTIHEVISPRGVTGLISVLRAYRDVDPRDRAQLRLQAGGTNLKGCGSASRVSSALISRQQPSTASVKSWIVPEATCEIRTPRLHSCGVVRLCPEYDQRPCLDPALRAEPNERKYVQATRSVQRQPILVTHKSRLGLECVHWAIDHLPCRARAAERHCDALFISEQRTVR
jgi:hypothetical protein